MKRFVFTLVIVSLILPAVSAGNIGYSILPVNGWVWLAPNTPNLEVKAKNNTNDKQVGDVTLKITTDKGSQVCQFTQNPTLEAGDSIVLSYQLDVKPGFYRCTIIDNVEDKEVENKVWGYEPEFIVSLPVNLYI